MPGCDNYVVLPSPEGWRIRFSGKDLGLFESRSEALRKAIESAQRSGRSGISARVYSQDDDGVNHPVWTFGLDGYATDR